MGQKVNVKFFTVDPYSGGTGVPRTFLELGKIRKNIFLKIKTSIIKSEKNIYQTIHNTSFIFNFFGIFTFFCIFPDFWKKKIPKFWKNYTKTLTLPQPNFAKWLWILGFFHRPQTCWQLWKNPKPFKKFTCWAVEAINWFFTHLSQGSPWPFA